MARDELTTTELQFKEKIEELVRRRAEAAKLEKELTVEIAAVCVDARAQAVTMALLADWVKVYDPRRDGLRSVSRQSVDQLVAAFEGRERAPRKKPERKSRILVGAFE